MHRKILGSSALKEVSGDGSNTSPTLPSIIPDNWIVWEAQDRLV